jgi:hypothetical protein
MRVVKQGTTSGSGSAMLAEGVESENYFTALAGDEMGEVNEETTATRAEDSAGGPSEAPSIKNPHKATVEGKSNNRQRTAEGPRATTKTEKRGGNRILEFATPGPTTTPKSGAGQTTLKGDETADGTEDTAAQCNKRTWQTAGRRNRKVGGFFHRLKPVMEGLLGQLEAALVTRMKEVPGERSEEEWDNVACPAIGKLVVNKQELFVRALLGRNVSSWDQTKLAFIRLHWMMDKRKTKAAIEERSVQDCAIRVYKVLQQMKLNEMKLVTTPIKNAQRVACTRGCAAGPAMWWNSVP